MRRGFTVNNRASERASVRRKRRRERNEKRRKYSGTSITGPRRNGVPLRSDLRGLIIHGMDPAPLISFFSPSPYHYCGEVPVINLICITTTAISFADIALRDSLRILSNIRDSTLMRILQVQTLQSTAKKIDRQRFQLIDSMSHPIVSIFCHLFTTWY